MVIGFGLLHGVGEGIEGLKKACISRAELPELEDYKKREKTHALSNKCHIILAVEALPSPLCSKTS
ncbi:MAG: hypothetical protein IKE16_00180, partial [Solobacterium sp.]|nr:hypothetical protein [Solobacterium sp.]